jgi:hypothetical protein
LSFILSIYDSKSIDLFSWALLALIFFGGYANPKCAAVVHSGKRALSFIL